MNKQQHAPIVIKVGGSFFTSLQPKQQEATTNTPKHTLLETIAMLQAKGQAVVLIHGGGEQVLKRLQDLGFKSIRKAGLRVTPDEHMPIVTSVLAGELNKQLVATCAKYNINAVGISLADGNIANCTEHPANIGAVGEPAGQNPALLNALLNANMVPIIASIGKDQNGRLYNVNADHAAICIAKLLNTRLYFFADVKGVLDENKQIIKQLDAKLTQKLVSNHVITDGMIVKVEAAQYAADQINQPVIIASWENADKILLEHQQCGTEILPNSGSVAHTN